MRKCREKISWKHRGIFKMSLKIFPIFLIFLVLLILPILFYRLSLVQDPRALTECEAFLKDNAEFVEHTARASCMDAGKLFFVLYFVPYDVHMAEIRNGKLESHVAFSCKVDSCKNEDVPWNTFKQKYTGRICADRDKFLLTMPSRDFPSFRKFMFQMENLSDREFDSLFVANDVLCNLYWNSTTRRYPRPGRVRSLVAVKNDSVLYVHGAGLGAGVFLCNFRTGEQREIFNFFHVTDDGFKMSLDFEILESSDTVYRVGYGGGDEVFYDGTDSLDFFIEDTSGIYAFVRYDLDGNPVLRSNAPEMLQDADIFPMDEFTAHRYLLKIKRYRIPFYGTDTAGARPCYREVFPFDEIECSHF